MDKWGRIKRKIGRAAMAMLRSLILAWWRRPRRSFSEWFWWLVPSLTELRQLRQDHLDRIRTMREIRRRQKRASDFVLDYPPLTQEDTPHTIMYILVLRLTLPRRQYTKLEFLRALLAAIIARARN